ncbi:UNVERIFIED_ORG: hypothetical protein ABID57_000700 [Arthrobacter sp. UYEF1]
MGLFGLKRNTVNLAETTKVPTGGSAEVGVVGQSIIGGYEDTEARVDKLTVEDYVHARQNDGTLASLYNILTLPILASSFEIEADADDANGEQADFIRKVLLSPPHKGGMEIPMSIVLADMLRGVLEGFRVFEKVYALQDGKIVYRKLASRDSQTVLLVRDDDGGYGGAHQRTNFKGRYVDVKIPAWKTFLYTYGKDKNFLYGESAFKAGLYHYNQKHKLYYLANLSVQTSAVPPKVLSGPSDYSTAERNRAMRMVEKLGGVRTSAFIPDKLTLTPYDSSKGRVDPLPLIDHHNIEMARSVLAQSITLGGTTGSKGGSYALSKDHTDILMIAIEGVKRGIEDHINHYLIPDLIDLNFAEPAYPEWHFEDFASDAKELVQAAFTQLITNGSIDPTIQRGIEDRVAETLDIDREAIQKELDQETAKKVAAAKKAGVEVDAQGNPLPPAPVVQPTDNKPQLSDRGSEGDPKGQTDSGTELSRRQRSESILRDYRSGSIL